MCLEMLLLTVAVLNLALDVQGSTRAPLPCPQGCHSGSCVNGSCVCDRGWVGERCQHCHGRFKITEQSGSLTDGPVHYKHKTKCTWILEGHPNSVLRVRFSHFATECSWDHMYVHDGDSIFSPLIAVFSGLVVPENRGNESVPEVVATSGYVLLHFFSDAAYNLTGFNIFYSMDSCVQNCSGHGRCVGESSVGGRSARVYCECEEFWKGEACESPHCPNNCSSPQPAHCDLTGEQECVCNGSWQGPDCSEPLPSADAFWEVPGVTPSAQPLGRASHQAVVHRGVMWVVGGYSFNYSGYHMLLSYELSRRTWGMVPVSDGPVCRYGHSLALHQDELYMFGGKLEAGAADITDELWSFDLLRRVWRLLRAAPGPLTPLEGHSAHVVSRQDGQAVMLVFFGYSPIHSYLSTVQEYHIGQNSWRVLTTRGALVLGGYGHSSVYDESSGYVFLHGGYKTLGNNKYGLVDHMYRYHVHTQTWWILKESGLPRFLHSMVLLSGALLVFGGNTHNDTSHSNGAKCFSADFLAYDIACDEWSVLPRPALLQDAHRFGHSAVVSEGSMLVFGGFSGVLLSDVLTFTPPSCAVFSEPLSCAGAGAELRCLWVQDRCVSRQPSDAFCQPKPVSTDEQCLRLPDCGSCTSSTRGCQWCEERRCISTHSNCTVWSQTEESSPQLTPRSTLSEQLSLWRHGAPRRGQSVRRWLRCPGRQEQECLRLNTCRSCSLSHSCQWESQQQQCQAVPGQVCEEGWDHVGDMCLQMNSSRESYDNAQHYCRNQGGNLVSVLTSTLLSYILEQIRSHHEQSRTLSPWVGLRKINISYWGWEDMSPFTNSSLRWLPGEPNDSGFCAYMDRSEESSLKAKPCTASSDGFICERPAGSVERLSTQPCRVPCSQRSGCRSCTSQPMECMWCGSSQRCVEASAYVISFPYGQCLEWTTQDCQAESCSGLLSCSECLRRVECGWCGDPSDTGTGVCMEGSYRGPLRPLPSSRQGPRALRTLWGREMELDPSLCSAERGFSWAFIHCPECQCNGHSRCINSSVCERCENLTSGSHCESCVPGHYGDPNNGGTCHTCKCNNHASVCHTSTGKCHCFTKGIKGDQCELCDSENRYQGNPLRGTCYYKLLVDYQFTFSLLQEDDHHYTAINFMASPEQAAKNLDMSINASDIFNLNISWSHSSTAWTTSGEQLSLISRTNIQEHRETFSCDHFNFRLHHNITFYVHLSNFSWPISIQIAFSQHNSILDLVQFFITFFSCFLSLLLGAALLWKLKQTCWTSRRHQQLRRERQQMARRPFASVAVALEVGEDQEEAQVLTRPVAEEPCWGGRVGVLTLLLYLPRLPSGAPPQGQSGLALVSALVDTSLQRTMNFKDRLGLKQRKHGISPPGCLTAPSQPPE